MCERCEIQQALIDEYKMLTEIGGVGFAVYVVDKDWPEYAYTVGLTALKHPELLLFGLGEWPLTDTLSAIGEDIRDGFLRPVANGGRVRFGEWIFTAMAFRAPRPLMPRAHSMYGRQLRVLQLICHDDYA